MSRFAGALACALMMVTSVLGLSITPTTDPATLAAALGGGGTLTIDSVSVSNGNISQFGIYNGFTSAPIVIGDGVVLSTGFAENTTSDSHSFLNFPSSNMGAGGTAEFDAYGPGHIASFGDSNDVAAVTVHFTLSADSQVGFDFIFGSVEYPTFVGSFTDAFLAFLDGTAPGDQIMFDASNNPVQVGTSFGGGVITADTNSAFSDPHGLLKLQTFTDTLSAGSHTIIFEVGDVNDHLLDSAAFVSNLRGSAGEIGTTSDVPEEGSVLLVGIGLAGVIGALWRKRSTLR